MMAEHDLCSSVSRRSWIYPTASKWVKADGVILLQYIMLKYGKVKKVFFFHLTNEIYHPLANLWVHHPPFLVIDLLLRGLDRVGLD